MTGPFMVEIVFCRVTRRGRKKRAGMNKAGKENMRNDGPSQSFIPPDNMVKLTLDLSDNGPVFSALDDMMMRMSMEGADDAKGKGKNSGEAKNALKNLLKSGIPGIEGMFGGEDPTPKFGKKGSGKKGFHKMNDASKKKFMAAIFGPDGTQIDSSTAAALLAATCSGGDPEVGNRLAELLVPSMDEKVDPAMMAALMSACSLINAGAGTEEVMNIMKMELAASGLSEEEILAKAQLLMKAFGKEDAASTAEYKLLSKQKNKALVKAEIPPKDFSAIVLAHKAIAACGVTPENCAKLLMILSTLAKKGANPFHLAQSMKNLGMLKDDTKAACKEAILKAWANPKITKQDVMVPVRMHQALDNENEPGWVEVKQLKDIVGGCAPSSPEAIELNLARAIKSGGMKNDDIGKSLIAFKAIAALGVDPVTLAKVMFMEKTICDNGVPGSEVGRVLSDGVMPQEAVNSLVADVKDVIDTEHKPGDIETTVNLYNNLKFKSNIPTEVIEFVDKSLIQVRCSLEDVADNMISSLNARGEKQSRIIGQVTEMLKKTGATCQVTATTLLPPLVELTGETEAQLTKTVARNLKEVEYETEDVKSTMTDIIVKIIEDDASQYAEAISSEEQILKDCGMSLPEIKAYMAENLPPPPTPPEEVERRRQMQEQLEALEKAEAERERLEKLKVSDPEAYEREMNPKAANKALMGLKGDSRAGSRRGSMIPRSRGGSIQLGGAERRGSYYEEGVTQRATVAMVTDDPEHKKNVKAGLAGAFDDAAIKNGSAQSNGVMTNGDHAGSSLPPGTKVTENPDGSISVGGKTLPPGAVLETNPDGSVSVKGDLPQGTEIQRQPDGTVIVDGKPLPAELTVVTNADGTLSIVPNPLAGSDLPSNATFTKDGSLVLAPDTEIVQNQDGSLTVAGKRLPAGTKVQRLPDGSVVVSQQPLVAAKKNPDGSLSIGGAILPSSSQVTEGGSIVVPKSSKVTHNPDGSVSIDGQLLPPGTCIQMLEDGSCLVLNNCSNINGSILLPVSCHVVSNQDGSVTIDGKKLPKGTQVQRTPDGGFVILQTVSSIPPGSKVTQNPDGSISVDGHLLPHGSQVSQNSDGSYYVTSPASQALPMSMSGSPSSDGVALAQDTPIIKGPDGSLIVNGVVMPPGSRVEVAGDGSLMLVSANPSQAQVGGPLVLPPGCVHNQDGSISLPPNSRITRNQDGTLSVDGNKLPLGTKVVTNADGSLAIVTSRVSVKTEKDGSLLVGNVRLPSGTVPNSDGSFTVPANAKFIKNPDGSITFDGKIFPPGTKLSVSNDGSHILTLPQTMSNSLGLSSGLPKYNESSQATSEDDFAQSPKNITESDTLINIFGAPTLMDLMVAENKEEIPAVLYEEEVQDVFKENKIHEDKIPQEMGELAQLELGQTVNDYDEGKTAAGSAKNIENISKANLENEHELKSAHPMLHGKTVVKNMQGLDCLKQHFRHVISSLIASLETGMKYAWHDGNDKSRYLIKDKE